MFGMALNSAKLFFSGKLFHDNGKVFATIAGCVAAAAALFLVAMRLGLPLPGAAALAGFLGGALQPWLLRNVKYR